MVSAVVLIVKETNEMGTEAKTPEFVSLSLGSIFPCGLHIGFNGREVQVLNPKYFSESNKMIHYSQLNIFILLCLQSSMCDFMTNTSIDF